MSALTARLPLTLCLAFLLAACPDKPAPAPGPGAGPGTGPASGASAGTEPGTPAGETPTSDPTLLRERAAARLARDERSKARAALAPLVAREDAALEDLVRAAAVELADNQTEPARAFLARAEKKDAENAAVLWLRGQMAREAGEAEAARELFRRALAAAPEDLPARLALADTEEELGSEAEAERLYREVVSVGAANGGAWYAAAVYRLSNLLTRAGREEEAARFDAVRRQLEARGQRAPTTVAMMLGELARVRPPAPSGTTVALPEKPPAFTAGKPVAGPRLAGRLLARDVDGDRLPDVVALGADGVWVFRNAGGTLSEPLRVVAEPAGAAELFDLENDGDLDLALALEGKLALFTWTEGAFARAEVAWPATPENLAQVVALDYDHEGDLDLALASAGGLAIWRNDSQSERAEDGKIALVAARFADASEDAGLPSGASVTWCLPEDYDGDNDVDLLVGGAGGVALYDSLRDGKFARVSDRLWVPGGAAVPPLAADFDGDARVDLFYAGAPSTLAIQGSEARRGPDAPPTAVESADVDLDGALDALWLDPATRAVTCQLALGLPPSRTVVLAEGVEGARALAVADFDGDQRVDLALLDPAGVRVLANAGPTGRGALLAGRGLRDNARALGAVVEFRAGPVYRRIYWRGEPQVLGAGARERFDVLRITWPNGVVDTRLDVELARPGPAFDEHHPPGVLAQTDGQVGSCPFLYAFDGQRNVFVSDVLGITPLGLRMAPGAFVPPDHDEYVLVRGEQLAPKDGVLELHLTEELREVTYLDHAQLLVVDHPVGTEVFPNELFCFPPFPEPHVHSLRAPLAPSSATGSDGRDWTSAVRDEDDLVAQPMKLLAPQFAGLAEPWYLELAFDGEALASAPKLRLLLTGWFYWSDASANMAAARAGNAEFVPPLLQVPDGKGGWRDAGPPIGFPAGKTKTMVVDVSAILDRADPRLRVATTLRLYWDRVALALDGDDAELQVRELACSGARSWRRGFSAPLDAVPPGEANPLQKPERFDWDELAPQPRWNQHPGLYTRHGECLELVAAVDDRFVILGAGDALTLSFDAREFAPPRAGFVRDYLLYLDGWAKDRDPNTIQALEVEPLPFHGMSGYPYGPEERFPDTPAHQAWRREWLTRPAQDWIPPVSPRREREWLLGGS